MKQHDIHYTCKTSMIMQKSFWWNSDIWSSKRSIWGLWYNVQRRGSQYAKSFHQEWSYAFQQQKVNSNSKTFIVTNKYVYKVKPDKPKHTTQDSVNAYQTVQVYLHMNIVMDCRKYAYGCGTRDWLQISHIMYYTFDWRIYTILRQSKCLLFLWCLCSNEDEYSWSL